MAADALESAGYDLSATSTESIGYFLGASPLSHHLEGTPPAGLEAMYAQLLASNQANRVCYHLDLRGPSLTINTACSSGMVALKLAADSLRQGECDTALAAGTSLLFPQTGYVAHEGGLLSPSGQSRSLDDNADGAVMSDGAATLVLRRLSDAERSGQRVLGVLRSVSWQNDGGREDRAGYAVPSCIGQSDILLRAWKDAGLHDAQQLSYIECHGSGTRLGDAMELTALLDATARLGSQNGQNKKTMYAGSFKANIGNPQSASGLVGVIKAIAALRTGKVPPQPSSRFSNLTSLVDADAISASPVKLAVTTTNDVPLEARDGGNITVGVSSFGIGGTGGHAVISTH